MTSGDVPSALALRGVTKHYGRYAVLRRADLLVQPGEAVAVLGANGSGKSTLLRIAATLSRPGEGVVQVAGRDARREPESARRNLSVLTQDAPVYTELTPHEHLAWWGRVQDVPVNPDARLLDAGLSAVAHHPAGTLSRGQRQRLALALALLPPRPLLIMDEPFSGLDDAGRIWLDGQLAERRGNTALLLALHDTGDARRLADRAVRIEGGRIVEAPL